DPERLAFDAGTGLPSAVQAGAFAAQVGGYQTLARALGGLYEHNRRLRRVTEVLRGARGAIGQLNVEGGELGLFRRQQRVWNELRLQDLRDEIIALWAWRRGVEDLGAPHRLEPPRSVETRRDGASGGDPERAGRALQVLRS